MCMGFQGDIADKRCESQPLLALRVLSFPFLDSFFANALVLFLSLIKKVKLALRTYVQLTFVTWSDKKGLITHLQVLRYDGFLSVVAHQ